MPSLREKRGALRKYPRCGAGREFCLDLPLPTFYVLPGTAVGTPTSGAQVSFRYSHKSSPGALREDVSQFSGPFESGHLRPCLCTSLRGQWACSCAEHTCPCFCALRSQDSLKRIFSSLMAPLPVFARGSQGIPAKLTCTGRAHRGRPSCHHHRVYKNSHHISKLCIRGCKCTFE